MSENLSFLSRRLTLLCLFAVCAPLLGQTYRVESLKTITIDVPGATAAYSLDASCAEAAADNGVVTISGKLHGTTHVVVATASGAQPFDVVVTDPPIRYPPGFVNPLIFQSGAESGYYETGYNSSAGLLQSQLDFSRKQDDTTIHVHLVGTRQLGDLSSGEARTALSSASYEISTPNRDITILDRYLDESPLAITGSIVRGLHFRQDGWFFHAGYTSVASFDGLFLPARAEGVIEAGYRRKLSPHSSVTGSFYHFSVPPSDLVGRSGTVVLLTYAYSPSENLHLSADLGLSRGIAGSARLDYKSDRDNIRGTVRYAPSTFASLGATNLRGLRSDLSWTRRLTVKLSNDVTFYSNKLALPGIQQSTITAGDQLQYRLASHWSLFGGATGSSYQTTIPLNPPVRSLNAPAGLAFNSRHFGTQGQYQFSRITKQDTGGHQFRASTRFGGGSVSFSAFAERQTQAPTLGFVLNQSQGLSQALELLGMNATSIQQVDQLLSDSSYLFAAGYIKGATVNVVPVRSQAGGSINLMGRGHRPQVSYNFLYNDNHGLMGSTLSAAHSVLYTQRLGDNEFSLSYSIVATKMPGLPQVYLRMLSVVWHHQVQSVPSFIIPEHHGFISGIVFQDNDSKGTYQPGMTVVTNAEVVLDGSRRVATAADGSYRFSRVPVGKHQIAVSYRCEKPTFFSTPSTVEATENATINFGIGFSLSNLVGRIANDAGQGVMGVTALIRNKDQRWKPTTDGDGSFVLHHLPEGEYDVEIDEESVPPGYLTSELMPQKVTVGASIPGTVAFTVQASRSISGRVLTYDAADGKYIAVAARTVMLKEVAKTSTTDALGQYMFRNLASGSYTVAVMEHSGEVTKLVKLPPSPTALTNIDLQIGDR
jgi:hypothetical protein